MDIDLKKIPLSILKPQIEEILLTELIPFPKVNMLLKSLKKISQMEDADNIQVLALSALAKFHEET